MIVTASYVCTTIFLRASRICVKVISSHIYKEGNRCADKLANHGHVIDWIILWYAMPPFITDDSFRDRYRLPNFCFP